LIQDPHFSQTAKDLGQSPSDGATPPHQAADDIPRAASTEKDRDEITHNSPSISPADNSDILRKEIGGDDPTVTSPATSINPHPDQGNKAFRDRPSMAKRFFWAGALVVIVAVLFGVWGWEAKVPTGNIDNAGLPGAEAITGAVITNQVQLGATSASMQRLDRPEQTSVAAEASADPQRFGAISNDLATMRHIVEQLNARQDAMARDIATLQAERKSLNEKIEGLNKSMQSFNETMSPPRRTRRQR
jgi:hypothetical protein